MMAAERQGERPAMLLSQLLGGLAGVAPEQDRTIGAMTLDSRDVSEDGLFVALAGTRTHGLAFAEQALARGARAILFPAGDLEPALAERLRARGVSLLPVAGLARELGRIASRFYGEPSAHLAVTGVTGTDGKTSVAHLLAQALDRGRGQCGLIGTLGRGPVNALKNFGLTTPDAISLQRILAELVQQGASHAVMEVSSHALAQHRVDGTRFAVAVLTNLGRDHLDYHAGAEGYAEAKARLFAQPGLHCAVLNLDDRFGRELARGSALQVIGYGLEPAARHRGAALWAERLTSGPRGLELEVNGRYGRGRLSAPLLGEFNAANLLAAGAALVALDWNLEDALEALGRVRTIPGRMELLELGLACRVVVDYAHTPQALERALLALRPLTPGRLWCVFGCGGERDRGKRALMGGIAERLADRVVVTDDNPRGEDPQQISAEILSGMRRPARVQLEHRRRAAIRLALAEAGAEDTVLIAGKGHETFQQVGAERLAHDDRAVARELARELGA